MPGPKNHCPRLWRIARSRGIRALKTRKGAGHRTRPVSQLTYIDVLGKARWWLDHTHIGRFYNNRHHTTI